MSENSYYYVMQSKYRCHMDDPRRIAVLSVRAYELLLNTLKDELAYAKEVFYDPNMNDKIHREFAKKAIIRLNKYITMLEVEAERLEDAVYVPFFVRFEEDLFFHLLCNITGDHYIRDRIC